MSEQPEPEKPITGPELQASIDQLAAMAPELARGYKKTYDAFVETGFDPMQALALTMSVLHT